MAANTQRKLVSATQLLLALALIFGLYKYGIALDHGSVPGWVDTVVSLIFIIGVSTGMLLQARHSENVYIGNISDRDIALEGRECPLQE